MLVATPPLGAQRSELASAVLAIVLTAVIATLSYYALERPIRARVRRWLLVRSGSTSAGHATKSRTPQIGEAMESSH